MINSNNKAMDLIHQLKINADAQYANSFERFFKKDMYGNVEKIDYLGVPVPLIRQLCKLFLILGLDEISILIQSTTNEIRMAGIFILNDQYKKSKTIEIKNELYEFYLNHIDYMNNWHFVDASAPYIMGPHLLHENKSILLDFAHNNNVWKRRIAIITTLHFIRSNQLEWTIKIAELLLNDPHDLIHKSVGWMLREVGKKNISTLILFLNQYAHQMPRTMLRYAIEKMSKETQIMYRQKKSN
jgi:3-methyladenine DNA glycosylase AlkD